MGFAFLILFALAFAIYMRRHPLTQYDRKRP